MRILYLNPSGQLGGAETSLLELLSSVRKAEPDWELSLILGEDGPLVRKVRDLGVRTEVLPFPPALAQVGEAAHSTAGTVWALARAGSGIAWYIRKLALAIRAANPDIIHSNGQKMHVLSRLARPRRTPIVWHIHDFVSTRPFMSRLLGKCASGCSMAIVNSNSVGADLAQVAPNLSSVAIYNAVDLKRFAPIGERLDLDKLSGLPPAAPGTIRAGLVGTFARWKGHKVFLQALAQLPPHIRGYIVGGPIYQTAGSQFSIAELREECERLGLTGRVGITGFLLDTAAAMRSLDIVVHASTKPEPFGMVVIEAMASAKAVVASRAGGTMELFTEGENAVSHPPGDVSALARQLRLLFEDEPLRRRLGTNGRATAEEFYGGDRLARELVPVYRRFAH
jgi:glycosyltransferase involved in cell wall biosynthesis